MIPTFERICQPLNRYTFKAPLIKQWVEKVSYGQVLNLFAGVTLLNLHETRIDLDPETKPDHCMDALEYVKLAKEEGFKFDTVILDPPYAYRKSMEKYKGIIASPFRQLKDELCSIVPLYGQVVTFGYHSNSMGAGRGFELSDILLICHGGAQHDTIAIVEKKIKEVSIITKEPNESFLSDLDDLLEELT